MLFKSHFQGFYLYRHSFLRLAGMLDENLDILDGTGQVLLNPHPPQPAPSCPVESVARRLGKGPFHEMLPGLDVLPGFS